MNIDKTTLKDLSIYNVEENQSVISALDFTLTNGGRHWLGVLFSKPYSNLKPILQTQHTLSLILKHRSKWPAIITNGTVLMLERFFESQVDQPPKHPHFFNALSYKILHSADYSLSSYTIGHAIDFFKGIRQLINLFDTEQTPDLLTQMVKAMEKRMNNQTVLEMIAVDNKKRLSKAKKLRFTHFILFEYKAELNELIDWYSRLDAYYGLATAIEKYQLCMPEFVEGEYPIIEAKGLYHILLKTPVAYHLEMNQHTNFVFLTGANMAGKSTFIKSVGISVFLAHLGMGVPATQMRLSIFNGLLSNIQVSDNIMKGESYFYNEVQRIKTTIQTISNGDKWLVLIDELFKGTNVLDAMRCSSEVVKGFLKIKNSLFILSTHLYEIGEELQDYDNIIFRYFETSVHDDQLSFSYQLKQGISNDRLGYLILKREGVVDMLQKL